MEVECEEGRRLLDIRDAAIDASRDLVKATLIAPSGTEADRHGFAEQTQAVFKVHQPAFDYNAHRRKCPICQVNPPISRHSISFADTGYRS
jgi:hypothetical protein